MSERVRMNITAYWNALSQTYDEAPDHRVRSKDERAAWLAVLRPLPPPPPARLLDLGTGTGFLALLLAELGHRLLVIDGLWALGAASDPAPPPADDLYATHYTPAVRAQLPLIDARTLDQLLAPIEQAGFVAPHTLPPEVMARLGHGSADAGQAHPGRFIVTARRADRAT